MRHRKRKATLDRTAAGRRSLLRNLAVSVILYEKVRTTDARARAIRPIVERLVTLGRSNDLATRRRLLAYLPVKNATKKVIEVLGPRYRDRKGGYLRITKLGQRPGDGGSVVQIEFVV
ncbi:MAG: 50S ribosomal protein L17 [bacterium]|nr:50S ribosomal protein L17 [bacterium]